MNIKKIVLAALCGLFLVQSSQAATIPYSSKLGSAVATLIAGKSAERVTGIALNSLPPAGMAAAVASQTASSSYQSTIQVASFVATGILTAAIAAGTSPVWLTILLGTAASVAIPLTIDSAVSWLSNGNGTVTSGSSGGDYPGAIPGYFCYVGSGQDYGYASTCGGAFSLFIAAVPALADNGGCTGDLGNGYRCKVIRVSDSYEFTMGASMMQDSVNATCPSGSGYTGSNGGTVCKAYSPPAGSSVTQSVASAVAALPEAELSKPASPVAVAAVVNALWQGSSSTPGSIPFDPAHPITAADVSAYQAAYPAEYPAVRDLVAPGINPASGSVSMPIPGAVGGSQTGVVTGTSSATTTNTATGTTTVTNTTSMLDWGTFIAPDLTAPPIESILDPLFNLFPDWKAFAFPQHQSVCPTPSFTLPAGVLNGRTVKFDQMCLFLDYSNTRTFMEAAFSVAWSILIIFIIMGA